MSRWLLVAIALAAAAVLVAAPLAGWPPVVRLDAVIGAALLLAAAIAAPWRWSEATWRAVAAWTPSRRTIVAGSLSLGGLLFWFVLTRFESTSINAVDFTVHFDRPCFQTIQGRPLWVETTNVPWMSNRTGLATHAYWGLLPLCFVYTLALTPLWLLGLSVVAVVAGALHVLRITRRIGAPGPLSVATALAFALNDNTARTLNYGFHPEVLYAWFVPWLLDAGLAGRRLSFVAAVVACVSVKEDACMPLAAACTAVAIHRFRQMGKADVAIFIVFPLVLSMANLIVYLQWILPAMASGGPFYASFWANYGDTPARALWGMFQAPWSVVARTLGSGLFPTVLAPFLFLPLVGWRWTIGTLPIVLLYGASANEQLRAYGIYYAIVLVPFFAIGASAGGLWLARRVAAGNTRPELAAAGAILLGALVVGFGYSLRPWRAEAGAASTAVTRLAGERVVLVQSGLYPHAGYHSRVQLLTPATLTSPQYAGAVVLLAPALSAYPFERGQLDALAHLEPVREMPAGLRAIRRPRRCRIRTRACARRLRPRRNRD